MLGLIRRARLFVARQRYANQLYEREEWAASWSLATHLELERRIYATERLIRDLERKKPAPALGGDGLSGAAVRFDCDRR